MKVRNLLFALLLGVAVTACGSGGGGGLSAAGLHGFGSDGIDGLDLSGTPRAAPTSMGALETQ